MSEQDTKKRHERAGASTEVSWQNGLVTGLSGKRVAVNGVLDLRKVPATELSALESLQINGAVLLDEDNRNALSGVKSEINGTVLVVDPDLRLIIEPDMVFSKAAVEAMPDGQKLMLVGNVFFKPDVPPDLIAQKYDRLYVVGILLACEGVYGALLGKMERTGISITLPQDVGEVIRSMGHNTWTEGYLSHLSDGITYVNVGVTRVADDVPLELVEQKIRSYHNVGHTEAPEEILMLLKARCPTNMGNFSSPERED